jgi:hypothetical protein
MSESEAPVQAKGETATPAGQADQKLPDFEQAA